MRFLVMAALLAGEVQAADVVAWKGAEMSAWTNHLLRCANPRMTAEGVAVEAVGCDPQLYAQPSAPFVGEYNHYVEIVLRSSVAGRHQLFWSSEKKGRCTWDRRADFDVKRAGEWETHVVRPVWIGEGRITSLRIDPPDSLRGLFELRSVRVFADDDARGVDTRKFSGVVFDAATLGQEYASITWISDVAGRKLLGFTTSPDGARHAYWFDFTNRHNLKRKHTGEKAWSGTAYALTVEQVLSGKKLPGKKPEETGRLSVALVSSPTAALMVLSCCTLPICATSHAPRTAIRVTTRLERTDTAVSMITVFIVSSLSPFNARTAYFS